MLKPRGSFLTTSDLHAVVPGARKRTSTFHTLDDVENKTNLLHPTAGTHRLRAVPVNPLMIHSPFASFRLEHEPTPPMTPVSHRSRSATPHTPLNRRGRRRSSAQASLDGSSRGQRVLAAISSQELVKMRTLFESFDTERTGSIDVTNLMPLLKAMGHPMPEEQARDLLMQVDVNQNGLLEYPEFLQLVTIFKDVAQFRIYEKTDSARREDSSRFTLSPNSKVLWLLEILMLAALTYIAASVTSLYLYDDLQRCFDNAKYFDTPDIVVTFVLFAQMMVRFFVAKPQTRNTRTTDREHLIASSLEYARTLLLCDVVALLPLRMFSADPLTSIVLGHFRLAALIRFPTILAAPKVSSINREYINFFYVAAPVLQNICTFFIVVHTLAVVGMRTIDNVHTYAAAVYQIMYLLSSVGYGDLDPGDNNERIYIAAVCVVAMLANGIVVGGMVSFFSQSDVEATRRHRLVQTLAVLNFFEVPQSLQEEILQFQDHVMKKDLEKAFGYLTDHLPREMKSGLTLQFRLNLVRSVTIFAHAHESAQIMLAQQLTPQVFTPEEYAVLADEVGDAMFFINYGFIDLFTRGGTYLETRGANKHFGAEAIFEPFKHIMASERQRDITPLATPSADYLVSLRQAQGKYFLSAKTITFVEVLVLTSADFTQVMTQFPRFRMEVEQAVNTGTILAELTPRHVDDIPDKPWESADMPVLQLERVSSDSDIDAPTPSKSTGKAAGAPPPELPQLTRSLSASVIRTPKSPDKLGGALRDNLADVILGLEQELAAELEDLRSLLDRHNVPILAVSSATPSPRALPADDLVPRLVVSEASASTEIVVESLISPKGDPSDVHPFDEAD
jgi:hypothetical protein